MEENKYTLQYLEHIISGRMNTAASTALVNRYGHEDPAIKLHAYSLMNRAKESDVGAYGVAKSSQMCDQNRLFKTVKKYTKQLKSEKRCAHKIVKQMDIVTELEQDRHDELQEVFDSLAINDNLMKSRTILDDSDIGFLQSHSSVKSVQPTINDTDSNSSGGEDNIADRLPDVPINEPKKSFDEENAHKPFSYVQIPPRISSIKSILKKTVRKNVAFDIPVVSDTYEYADEIERLENGTS